MRCSKCGTDNRTGRRFCRECGVALDVPCPKCGTANQPGEKFCGHCGASLIAEGAPSSPRPPASPILRAAEGVSAASAQPSDQREAIFAPEIAPDGERKTITALFADIKGSMELMEDLDPEEARAIIDPALQLMMEAVRHYGGHVAQSTGDGIFALFGAPIAHEDHPQRALYAALRMQADLASYGEKLQQEGRAPIYIRVGLNTGEVVVRSVRKDESHADYLPIGHSTGLAERMQSIARPGSIMISEHTQKLTEGYFSFKAMGPARIKGASEPIKVFEVLGVGPLRTRLQRSARRGLARFVGRDEEMRQMRYALDRALDGHGQIVAAMGEAGIGKSRLFHEFKIIAQSVALPSPSRADARALLLETFSVSHGKASPYLPLIELLNEYFQITAQDDERRRREKVTGRVLTLDRQLEEILPFLFAVLGMADPSGALQEMDPEARRQRTQAALKRLLLRESRNQPLILIFEDLHWIDTETEAFLAAMSASIAAERILLLVNYRPEYKHAWKDKPFYTELRLAPLRPDNARELLSAQLGDDRGMAPLKQLIVERTEGNPFFMEEMVQALFDQGALVRNGTVSLARPLAEIRVPPTVQGIIAARIDRLAPEEKGLLQTLAVIGKEFPLSLATRASERSLEQLQPALSGLEAGEFLYEEADFPESSYVFKHALTQEVAYNTLLIEERRVVHGRVARAIEALFAERLEDRLSELAHHYVRSGDTAKAITYLERAADQARERCAYTEALNLSSEGLELIKALPETPERDQLELRLLSLLGVAMSTVRGSGVPELEHVLKRALELNNRGGESSPNLGLRIGLWGFHLQRAELRVALELAEQLQRLTNHSEDPAPLAAGNVFLGTSSLWSGQFVRARSHLERAKAIFATDLARYAAHPFTPVVQTFSALAWALWLLGYPEQAKATMEDALQLARESKRPNSIAHALQYSAELFKFLGDWASAKAQVEALIAICTEHGFLSRLAAGTFALGGALAREGKIDEAFRVTREGLEGLKQAGNELVRLHGLPLFGQLCCENGQTELGLELVNGGIASLSRTGPRLNEAELYRVRAELLLKRAAPADQVEKDFRRAIEIARGQQGKSFELRATMSFCRMLRARDAREEAKAMLAPISAWFSEGHDTPDLKQAKALLKELGA